MHKTGHIGMMLVSVLLVVQMVAGSASGQVSSPSETAKRFIGTWRLVSITGQANSGLHPTGLIYYDGTAHMAVQIMREGGRPKYAGTLPTPDEARAAIIGYTAYFGTYTVDERAHTVTHHRTGNINPGALGDFVRGYEFASDDRLILRPVGSKSELTWERIK